MSVWGRAGAVGAAVVVTGGVVYLVWNHLSREEEETPRSTPAKEAEKAPEKTLTSISEAGERDREVKSEHIEAPVSAALSASEPEPMKPRGTQVLVLGLDGAGKSSLLRSFSNSWADGEPQPTQGLHAVSISREDLSIEFLEIGGSLDLRQYWQKYLPKALMLVYVVDASNAQLFPLAKTHLHELLASDPLLPLMVLANKQDCAGAKTITDLHEALSLSDVGDRRLYVIGTYVQKEAEEPSSGVTDALELIIDTIQRPR